MEALGISKEEIIERIIQNAIVGGAVKQAIEKMPGIITNLVKRYWNK